MKDQQVGSQIPSRIVGCKVPKQANKLSQWSTGQAYGGSAMGARLAGPE